MPYEHGLRVLLICGIVVEHPRVCYNDTAGLLGHVWDRLHCTKHMMEEERLTAGSRCSMFMMRRTLSEQMTAFFMAKSVHSCPRASSTSGRSPASETLASLTAWRTLIAVEVCSLRHLSNACIWPEQDECTLPRNVCLQRMLQHAQVFRKHGCLDKATDSTALCALSGNGIVDFWLRCN